MFLNFNFLLSSSPVAETLSKKLSHGANKKKTGSIVVEIRIFIRENVKGPDNLFLKVSKIFYFNIF